MTLLLVLSFVLLVACFRGWSKGWRESLLLAALGWGTATTVVTELLSAGRWLSARPLAGVWLALDVAVLVVLLRSNGAAGLRSFLPTAWRDVRGQFRTAERRLTGSLVAVALIVLLVGITALASAPNTAVQYHAERVLHWSQNHTVAFYPTHNLRQLYMPPWAEYAILQFHLLHGGDRFANVVQWFSMTASVVGASLVARFLGAGPVGEMLAAVLVATLPQGIVQASGAQNDYVAAFWLLQASLWMMAYARIPTALHALALGTAVGLALLTKWHMGVFLTCLGVVWLVVGARSARAQFARHVPIMVGVALALNAGHAFRCLMLSGDPDTRAVRWIQDTRVLNERFGPGPTFSNVVRVVATSVATPIDGANQVIERVATNLLRLAGQDPEDRATTWAMTHFSVPVWRRDEFMTINPLHAMLGVAALAAVLGRRRREAGDATRIWAVGLAVSFVAFCALFKWQPWHARLLVGLFVLGSAVTGAWLGSRLSAAAAQSVATCLLLFSAPFVLANTSRPLLFDGSILNRSRFSLYTEVGVNTADLIAAAAMIRQGGCANVGYDEDVPGYPMAAAMGLGDVRVRYVNVTNASQGLSPNDDEAPTCAVVCPRCAYDVERWGRYDAEFGRASVFGTLVVFAKHGEVGSFEDFVRVRFGCALVLGDGWFDLEADAGGWWRWADRAGDLIVVSSADAAATLTGDIATVPVPNHIEVVVDEQPSARVAAATPGWHQMPPLRVSPSRRTRIRMTSGAPAERVAGDRRPLAFSIKNARLSLDSGFVCQVVQRRPAS